MAQATQSAADAQRPLVRPERAALARLAATRVPYLARFLDFADPRPSDVALDLARGGRDPLPTILTPLVAQLTTCDLTIRNDPALTRPDQPAIHPEPSADPEDAVPPAAKPGRLAEKGAGRRTPTLVFARRAARPARVDASALPYHDGTFSLVTARFALYRTADPQAALREMLRVCRPDGRVVIADLIRPDHSTPDRCNGIERLLDPDHPTTPSLTTLLAMVNDAGGDVPRLDVFTVERPLTPWLGSAAKTSTGRHIRKLLIQEVDGGRRTGAKPRVIGNELWFTQTWIHLTTTPKS